MTDADWYAAESPEPLLAWLRNQSPHPEATRITFLYAAACYRLNWDAHDPAIRAVVEMLESRARIRSEPIPPKSFLQPLLTLFAGDLTGAIGQVLALSGTGTATLADMATQSTRVLGADAATQLELLRELHPPPSIRNQPLALSRQIDTIASLAAQIDDRGEYDLMPVLGDLLDDAGADAPIVSHCRSTGRHRHGCWAIEHILEFLRKNPSP
jgi:hypothetical protein